MIGKVFQKFLAFYLIPFLIQEIAKTSFQILLSKSMISNISYQPLLCIPVHIVNEFQFYILYISYTSSICGTSIFPLGLMIDKLPTVMFLLQTSSNRQRTISLSSFAICFTVAPSSFAWHLCKNMYFCAPRRLSKNALSNSFVSFFPILHSLSPYTEHQILPFRHYVPVYSYIQELR